MGLNELTVKQKDINLNMIDTNQLNMIKVTVYINLKKHSILWNIEHNLSQDKKPKEDQTIELDLDDEENTIDID